VKVKVIKAIVERYRSQFQYLNKNDVEVEDKRYGKDVKYVAKVTYKYESYPGGSPLSFVEDLEIRLNLEKVFEDEASALAKLVKENTEKYDCLFEDATEALKWLIDNVVNAFENYERHVKMYEITSDYPKGEVEVVIYD